MMWFLQVAAVVVAALLAGCTNAVSEKQTSPFKHRHASMARIQKEKVFPKPTPNEDTEFWRQKAQDELKESLKIRLNTNKAKNVILFLGDGMGIPTVTASRIYKGQQLKHVSGEEQQLSFETFPHVALSKTYCVDRQVPDSASTGTAYLSGVKTNYELVGLDSTVQLGNCTTITDQSKVSSIVQWAQDQGKRTGVVTSTRITHATPAASYAHSGSRDWECDSELTADIREACPDIKDIARQLIEDEPGRSLNVIMGGGYQYLSVNAESRPMDPVDKEDCYRQDGKDMYQQWKDDRESEGKRYAAVRSKSDLMDQDGSELDHLLGIFANGHLPWEFETRDKELDIPTLADMTKKAIEVLNVGEEGFFLLVEGGRIDHAHHDGTARKALDETLAFDEAITTALELLGTEDTLMVVTADHSHVMTINGYPDRGQDIVGLGGIDSNELPYTTLMYTNGKNFDYTVYNETHATRRNISADDVTNYEYLQLGAFYRTSETHGGEDVGIYAIGPMSHLFHGVHEQNYIPHAMAYAACIGQNQDHCSGATSLQWPHWSLGIVVAALYLKQNALSNL